MAERWPEKLYALRGGPVPGYLEAALIVNHDGCHRNGIEIAEYVPASKLKEQEERCERLEEALRWLLSTTERHFEEEPVRNLDEVLSFARTALQHSPEDEGGG